MFLGKVNGLYKIWVPNEVRQVFNSLEIIIFFLSNYNKGINFFLMFFCVLGEDTF